MENWIDNIKSISEFLIHQLSSHWFDIDVEIIQAFVPQALKETGDGFKDIPSGRFSQNSKGLLNPYFSVHWMNFLYRLSTILYKNVGGQHQIRFTT